MRSFASQSVQVVGGRWAVAGAVVVAVGVLLYLARRKF